MLGMTAAFQGSDPVYPFCANLSPLSSSLTSFFFAPFLYLSSPNFSLHWKVAYKSGRSRECCDWASPVGCGAQPWLQKHL